MNVAGDGSRCVGRATLRQSAHEHLGDREMTMTRAGRARGQRVTALTLKSTDHDWYPVDPGNPSGPQMAALWGDPRAGAYGALLRVPAGFESPMHRHAEDERVIVISGASVHWIDGSNRDAATIVGPGDFVLMPAGVNHVSAAVPGEDCLEFITQDGPFDFIPLG
jgi:mannose-6-phosphate isomerase-like protein (cupin superfamily)